MKVEIIIESSHGIEEFQKSLNGMVACLEEDAHHVVDIKFTIHNDKRTAYIIYY